MSLAIVLINREAGKEKIFYHGRVMSKLSGVFGVKPKLGLSDEVAGSRLHDWAVKA